MYRFKLLLTLALLSLPAAALETDRQQPIELSADFADIDEAKGRSVYRGSVEIRQGSIRLRADEVTIEHQGRRPARLLAAGGPVRFSQDTVDGKVEGQAQRAEYDINGETLVLIGDAVVVQDKDTLRSDRIIYDHVRSVVRAGAAAEGKERVRITIQPPAN